MNEYLEIATGSILTEADVRAAHLQTTSLPQALDDETLAMLGLQRIAQRAPLEKGPGFDVLRDGVEADGNGGWVQRWLYRPWTDDQWAIADERQRSYLTTEATRIRWVKETSGLTLPNGVRVGTAAADQARITAVVANAELGGINQVDFKAASGWVTMELADVKAIAGAIARHVQSCFSAERQHHETIQNGFTDPFEYDVTTGWPA